MKLYGSAVAPNPRRVRIFLAEKDIEVPSVDIDIVKSEPGLQACVEGSRRRRSNR